MAQGIIVALGKVQASLLSLAHAEEYISMYEAALSHYLELLRMIQTDKVGLRHSAPFMHKFACKRTELCQSKLRTDDKKKEEDWFVGWLVGEPEHPITTTAKCQNKKGALRWTEQIWDAREWTLDWAPKEAIPWRTISLRKAVTLVWANKIPQRTSGPFPYIT